MKNKKNDQKGFTLVEILIIVVIIGILAAISLPQFRAYQRKAANAMALTDIKNFKAAMEAYYSDYREYPTM